MKKYYFVIDNETNEVLGFNLTKAKKDKLFYHLDTGDEHKSCRGRGYGATNHKAESLEDFENLMKIRNHFKNCVEYSYIILSETNQWLYTHKNNTEAQLMATIKKIKTKYPNAGRLVIFETFGNSFETFGNSLKF